MSITLSDIPAAIDDYLETKFTVSLGAVVADSGTLNPGEEGTCAVTVRNAAAADGGVRVRDVVLHFESSAPAKLKLKVPQAAALEARSTIDRSQPELTSNTFVGEMFVWYQGNETLDPSDSFFLNLEVKAIDEGSASITCHAHAAVDLDALFARDTSSNASRSVTVV